MDHNRAKSYLILFFISIMRQLARKDNSHSQKKTTRNIFTAAVAPTCRELAKRGLDFIRNLEPVIVAERP